MKYKYLLDHGIAHKISDLYEKGEKYNPNREFDIIQVLEILLFADDLIVMKYDEDKTQIRTSNIVEYFEKNKIKNSHKQNLLKEEPFDREVRKEIAISTARKIFIYLGDHIFDTIDDIFSIYNPALINIKPKEDRPDEGRDSNDLIVIPNFFKMIHDKNMSNKDARDASEAFLLKIGTMAYLVYGICHNDDILDKIKHIYKTRTLPALYWEKLNDFFRAHYNQNVADKYNYIYSPGGGRQTIIRDSPFCIIKHFNVTLRSTTPC